MHQIWTKGLYALLILILSVPAWADGTATPSDADHFVAVATGAQSRHAFDPHAAKEAREKSDTKIQGLVKTWTGKAAGLALQSAILVMVMRGVAIVEDEVQRAQLEKRPVDPAMMEALCLYAANSVIGSGDVWTGVGGAVAVETLLEKPAQILKAIVADATAKEVFAKLLASGIQSFGIFIGWEFGNQLWNEARELLDSEVDYKRSDRMMNVLTDLPLLHKLSANAVRILITDAQLRRDFFYNTWRLRIATGDFATLVTCMITATAVGTVAVPGAGTAIGMAFGIAGGLAAMTVPQTTKDFISLMFKMGRYGWNDAELAFNLSQIKSDLDSEQPLQNEISERREIRSNILTIYFEAYYVMKSRLLEAQSQIEIAKQVIADPKNASQAFFYQKHVLSENESFAEYYQKSLLTLNDTLRDYYEPEINIFNSLKINSEDLRTLNMHLKNIVLGFAPSEQEFSEVEAYRSNPSAYTALRENLSINLLREYHLRSFSEVKVVDQYNRRIK